MPTEPISAIKKMATMFKQILCENPKTVSADIIPVKH
jgi:hypothetical protein